MDIKNPTLDRYNRLVFMSGRLASAASDLSGAAWWAIDMELMCEFGRSHGQTHDPVTLTKQTTNSLRRHLETLRSTVEELEVWLNG